MNCWYNPTMTLEVTSRDKKRMMHPKTRYLVLLFAALALCLSGVQRSLAQDAAAPSAREVASGSADEFTTIVVELGAPSAVEVYLAEVDAAMVAAGGAQPHAAAMQRIAGITQAQVAAIAMQQDEVAVELAALGAVEIYRVQRVYNGIAIRLPVNQIEAVRALENVRMIHALVPRTLDNAQSVPHIGAQELWAGVGLTGAGIRIGIIDTGADYLHVGLGGPGKGYEANDTTIILDVAGFPNQRVVGGYDFAGDLYNPDPMSSNYSFTPEPDPDPMDCYGHGTHVTASAAGSGVTAAGKEYKGLYDATLPLESMRIGAGVAPHALIYALKVFGCAGSSNLVDQAIDWAIDPNGDGNFGDHLDVINLSLGSAFGTVTDTTTIAAERAARIGIIVVASAGNTGAAMFSVGSPGTGSRTISVAASVVDHGDGLGDGLGVGSVTDTLAGFTARGVRIGDNALKPDLSAPGFEITSAYAGSGNGMSVLSGTSMAAPMAAGAMVLLREMHPDWSVEELKALAMNTAMAAVRSEEDYTSALQPPMRAGAGRIALTTALSATTVAYNLDDVGLVSISFGAPEVLDTHSAIRNVRVVNKSDTDTTYYLEYRPVSDAAGVEILVPALPAVTVAAQGAATFALQMQANAALMNNVREATLAAGQATQSGHFRSEEAGYLWLWQQDGLFNARLAGATASPPSPSSGVGSLAAEYDPATRVLTYTLAASALDLESVTGVYLSRGLAEQQTNSIAHTIFAREGGVAVTLPLTGVAQLNPVDVPLLASGYLRVIVTTTDFPAGEIAGALIAVSPVLKLPVYAAPRAVSSMRAESTLLDFGDVATATRAITLTGAALTGTVFPTDTQSLVSAFELHARSPLVSFDEPFNTAGYSDIRFAGVSSDWNRVADKKDARVYFAIATWGKWSTPSQVTFEIRLDVDGDFVGDYRIYTTDMESFKGSQFASEVFVAVVEDMNRGVRTLADPINTLPAHKKLTVVFENDVLFISVPVALVGLSAGRSAFDFDVQSIPRATSALETGDWVLSMRYDMRRPGIQFMNAQAGSPLFVDAPETTINLGYNQVNYARSTAQGVLLLHHHNVEGTRAEVVDVRYTWKYNVMMPLIALDAFDAMH